MKNGIILAVAVAVIAIAGGIGYNAVRASGGSPPPVKAEIRLQSNSIDPLASGKAKSEQRTSPTRIRFSVEVEDVSTAGAHSVRITRCTSAPVPVCTEIANSPVSVTVDTLGFGDLEMNTQDSPLGTLIPEALAGDLVEVLNPDNVVILSGTLCLKGTTCP
jgi:hypothetical protein